MSSFDKIPTSNEYDRDTGRSGGDHDNNTGSAGFGNTQPDRFDSNTNTSGGYGQERSGRLDTNTNSNMDTGMNNSLNSSSNTGSGMNSDIGMNDSSFGSSRMDNTPSRTDNFSSESGNYGGMQRNEFDSTSNNRNEFDGTTTTGKVSMGDKLKGGAEKMAGKMTGNAGFQERGQERKMGELDSQRNDF
ncbi:hypothetical protein C8R43DRAFT_1229288 [Mycena crocata]|nr:hypothetical protein C8R43DRAFT_1229288 [Mycena crocata]